MKTESEQIAEGMKKLADSYPDAEQTAKRIEIAMKLANDIFQAESDLRSAILALDYSEIAKLTIVKINLEAQLKLLTAYKI